MPHIRHESDLALPAAFVWDYLANLSRYPEWMFGVQELVATGASARGLGTTFDGTFHVKPITLRCTATVSVWDEGSRLGLRSVAGFQQESTFELIELGPESTRLVATVDYDLPGGVAGKALGRALVPIFAACVRHSDAKLRERLLELNAARDC